MSGIIKSLSVAACLFAGACMSQQGPQKTHGHTHDFASGDEFTDMFPDEHKADLGPTGRNPYFILEPGYELVLEGIDDGIFIRLVVIVMDETRKIDGVVTRVVEEREADGKGNLIEVSRNFFAISKKTNGVYYFGEDVDMYKDGKVVSHEGEWISGKEGARFGLFMPGIPLLGARHYQEIAPGVALDRVEIESMTETVETPAGKFDKVLKVRETTPLENAAEYKFYKSGVGMIQDGPFKLIKYGFVRK